MTAGRILWCSALAISISEVSVTLSCQANCLMYGQKETTFFFRQQIVSDDDDAVSGESSSAYQLLSRHNAVRQDLAAGHFTWPPAANMRLMEWDQELEGLANESLALWLSTTCTLSPEECFWTTPKGTLGENYAMAGGPGWAPGIHDIFDSWTLLHSSTAVEDPKFWTSFSNVVAANSFRVGCGQAFMEERGLHARFLLCYYEPGLNHSQINDNIYFNVPHLYEPGDPCTKCPVGTSCDASSTYFYLCAANPALISGVISNASNTILQYSITVILMVALYHFTRHE